MTRPVGGLVALALAAATALGAGAQEGFSGVELVYQPAVRDMRVVGGLRSRSGNAPSGPASLKDLRVGSVFINEDDRARVVTAVYEDRGRVVIETEEPRPEDVIAFAYVPDFNIQTTQSHLAALGPGVRAVTSRGLGDASDLFAEGLAPAERAVVDWIDTDQAMQDGFENLETLRLDVPILKKAFSTEDAEKLKKMEASGKQKGTNAGSGGSDLDPSQGGGVGGALGQGTGTSGGATKEGSLGGKPDFSAKLSGEIRLKGVLRYTRPKVEGGFKAPSLRVSWIMHWWHPPIPKFEFTKGYGRMEVTAGQQFDFKLEGSLQLEAEVKIPIAMYVIKEPKTRLEFECGLYAKITFDGTVTFAFEVSEYTRFKAGIQADLAWPFIPIGVKTYSDDYYATAFRPTMTAQAELTGGLYVGADLSIAGIGLASFETGGGLYFTVNGYVEPMSIMGFAKGVGKFGSFDEWIIYVNMEAGTFVKMTLGILIFSKDLFHYRWPFWQYANQWEFL